MIDKLRLCRYVLTKKGNFRGTKNLYCEKCGFNSFTDIEPQTKSGNDFYAVYQCNKCKSIVTCTEKWEID